MNYHKQALKHLLNEILSGSVGAISHHTQGTPSFGAVLVFQKEPKAH
jgi:hypothetical protein